MKNKSHIHNLFLQVLALFTLVLLGTASCANPAEEERIPTYREPPFYKAEFVLQPGQYCTRTHSSTLTELPNGDLMSALWCGSREGASDARIMASRLRSGTDSWGPPETLADTPDRFDGNPVLFTVPDGRVWLFYSVRDPDAPGMVQIMTRESLDGGDTWTPPVKFVTERGVRTRNRPITIKGGEILLPLHELRSGGSLFFISPDLGVNWIASEPIVCPNGCIQPSVISRSDGSLYTLMRSWNEDPGKRYLLQSESHDFGRSWSPPTYSRIPTVSSAIEMIRLKNGHVVLAFNDGAGRERTSLNLVLSLDEGRTWTFNRVLESGKGPFSYPSLIQTRDGNIHITYTYRRNTIKHVALNEAWLLKGD